MNSIIMNFDDAVELDTVYNQLKKQYPKVEIVKDNILAIRAMERLQKVMAGEAEKLGFQNEEDAIKWIYEARDEIRSES